MGHDHECRQPTGSGVQITIQQTDYISDDGKSSINLGRDPVGFNFPMTILTCPFPAQPPPTQHHLAVYNRENCSDGWSSAGQCSQVADHHNTWSVCQALGPRLVLYLCQALGSGLVWYYCQAPGPGFVLLLSPWVQAWSSIIVNL